LGFRISNSFDHNATHIIYDPSSILKILQPTACVYAELIAIRNTNAQPFRMLRKVLAVRKCCLVNYAQLQHAAPTRNSFKHNNEALSSLTVLRDVICSPGQVRQPSAKESTNARHIN
jgi:hypothetical protein